MRTIEKLRAAFSTEQFSSIDATNILGIGTQNRLVRLVKNKEIERLKNGLYVFSPKNQNNPINKLVLANLLFGPSYVSLESAFEYYGLIPERVFNVTSVTAKRTKNFDTLIGSFIYRKIPKECFAYGIRYISSANGHFTIASKEKAILDKLYLDLPKSSSAFDYLRDSLRIEEEDLVKLDKALLNDLSTRYSSKKFEVEIKNLNNAINQ